MSAASIALLILLLGGSVRADGQEIAMKSSEGSERSSGARLDTAIGSFRIHFPVLSEMPPISRDMPENVQKAYLYFDNLLRDPRAPQLLQIIDEWSAGTDAMKEFVGNLYTVTDYDPARFVQYTDEIALKRGASYLMSLQVLAEEAYTRYRVTADNHASALYSLLYAEHIMHVRVLSIDSIIDKHDAEYNQYRVTAEVLDTLKGRRYLDVRSPHSDSLATDAVRRSVIQFQYSAGNYMDAASVSIDRDDIDFIYKKSDSAFLGAGGFTMRPGQEAVVFLRHGDHIHDRGEDSYNLRLEPWASYNALPVVDGKVRDVNNVWSDSPDTVDYQTWSETFATLKAKILAR